MTLVFQRLSSLGYCVSSSLPPMLAAGALQASHRLSSLGYCSQYNITVGNTGQPRYLKVQGNGENTSSYPKFDIAKM